MAHGKAEQSELYTAPMVVAPNEQELEQLSQQLGLGLTGGSPALASCRTLIEGIVGDLNKIGDLVEPRLTVEYPRTPGYRPNQSENPFNGWYVKSTIRGAESGKLSGKKIAIKDSIAVAGVPMMIGCYALEGYTPDFDASVVTRVLDAGGVILGKAVCEDLCLSGESFTGALGPVLNPVNTKHSAGGSSSGCAVLVLSDEVDMAIGGDQGGSVRIPASYCGIVGLKPTFGLVPYTGASSYEFTLDHLGPMTRTVEDCALMLEVLAGYDDGKDARQLPNIQVPNYSEKLKELDTSQLRIGVLQEGFGSQQADPQVDQLIRKVLLDFTKVRSASLQEVSIPLHNLAVEIGLTIDFIGSVDTAYTSGGVGFGHKGYHPSSMMKSISMRLKNYRTKLDKSHKVSLLCGTYLKENYSHLYGKGQNLSRQLTQAFDDVLNKCDVIAMPTIPFTAPPLPTSKDFELDFSSVVDMTLNLKSGDLTGHPSITIKAGMVNGLPVGLLLTGKRFSELELLQTAYSLEEFLKC